LKAQQASGGRIAVAKYLREVGGFGKVGAKVDYALSATEPATGAKKSTTDKKSVPLLVLARRA
jgi:hypothetical protein